MANQAHLENLKRGVSAWNQWRKEHPEIKPDFSGADLSKADLRRADLREANFRNADLSEANLNGVNLSGADLTGANFGQADLSQANLSGTNLSAVNFTRAVLREALLFRADFFRTLVTDADVSKAGLNITRFSGVDLSQAKGLDHVRHFGPSQIDIDTIHCSKGNISINFLRGVGVPEDFINYMPPPMRTTIEYYSCFISYSTKDQGFADRLHADLKNKGVSCWFASHDAKGGQKLDLQIDNAIRLHDKLLLILSHDSIRSNWVIWEIKTALKRELAEKREVLFPVSLVPFVELRKWERWDDDLGMDIASEVRKYLIPDFSQWEQEVSYEKALAKLLRDMKTGKTEHKSGLE